MCGIIPSCARVGQGRLWRRLGSVLRLGGAAVVKARTMCSSAIGLHSRWCPTALHHRAANAKRAHQRWNGTATTMSCALVTGFLRPGISPSLSRSKSATGSRSRDPLESFEQSNRSSAMTSCALSLSFLLALRISGLMGVYRLRATRNGLAPALSHFALGCPVVNRSLRLTSVEVRGWAVLTSCASHQP